MPVRKMTDEEAERIFGSGLVFFGMRPPNKPKMKMQDRESDSESGEQSKVRDADRMGGDSPE
jgi:hypothetical protein